jgi:hypothetical protein
MKKSFRYEWTKEKIEYLYEYYPTREYDILFEKLGFDNIDSIRHKAMDLGIRVVGYDYTEEDIEFLKENYDKFSYEEIAEILSKSVGSISMKINRLGLLKSEKWSDEEIKLLKQKYPHYTNKYLSEKLFIGRAPNSIRTKALHLGLHKSEEKGLHFFDKDEMIEMLIDLSEKLCRTPTTLEIFSFGLPSETSYRRYFGSYKNACELAGIDICTAMYGRAQIHYSKNNDKCFSKSELEITDFLIDNNIDYEKDKLYSTICNDL